MIQLVKNISPLFSHKLNFQILHFACLFNHCTNHISEQLQHDAKQENH